MPERLLRYGENAYQTPAVLRLPDEPRQDPLGLEHFRVIAGQPGFNSYADLDRLLQTVTHFAATYRVNRGYTPLIAVACKHGNPCGASVGKDPLDVLQRMIIGDMRAIFGGLVMTNFQIGVEEAECLRTHGTAEGTRRLLDGIIAPVINRDAVGLLERKGAKCKLFENEALASLDQKSLDTNPRFRYVRGGVLEQPNYTYVLDFKDPELQQFGELSAEQATGVMLAWAICSTSNSNTISLVGDRTLIGNGAGQQDRVTAAQLAYTRAINAGHSPKGAVACSDSFFPFNDGVEVLVNAGVSAIFTSSGSVNDAKVQTYCRDQGVTLLMIPDAIGRGFFGH